MSHNQAVGATHDEPKIEGLQPGAKLLRGQYEILRFLSNGGFGITYLARDSLERDVVIKECFPGALCRRNGDLVEPNDPSYKEDLRAIIDLFIQEARNHARLVHPNIVDVHQVFEDNDTAYIAMDLIRGCDLLDYVENPENDAGPDFIVQVTEKMLSAVSFIHQSGMLHRDISPDNILIDENSDPVLIDFGAAREQAANKSAALLTLRVIKDGYSPHEFYVRGAEQGPSSDLYVLAATLYHAISGERPVDGQSRLNAFNNGQDDPYTPLAGRFEGYPDGFLEAIDKAMEVHTTDRLQTALDWLRMFRGPGVMFDTFAYRPVSVIVGMDRKDKEEEKARIKAESENAEAVVTALLAGNSDIVVGNDDKKNEDLAKLTVKEETPVAVDTVVQSGSGGSGKLIAGVAVVAVALAAGGYFAMSGDKPEAQIEAPAAQATDEVQTAGAAASASEVTSTVTEEPEAEIAAVPEPEPETAPLAEEPVEQAQAETAETVVTETAPVTPDTSETEAQVATVAEAEPEVAASGATPAEQQVSFAHWDVEIPFQTSRRRGSTGPTIAVTGLNPNQDMSVIGDWVQRGAVIFTLNGKPIREDATFAAQVLDKLSIDPDGYTRVAARYRPLGQTRAQNGLLALPVVRSVGLENGYTFTVSSSDDEGWKTVVESVPSDAAGGLQRGDVLLSESQSRMNLDGSESLDAMLVELVAEGQPEANLTVLRNGAEAAATMQLAQE
ncbi:MULTISPECIES: serine/threonine-protein kinase [unclassified Ruegeria]|uniref:serine/threonine protein kinase n=1 Tax=unclassified Ruegeria TaxID=2625375 RepID=UPI0014879F0B|nr:MULTISPECIES: serine/threonine-protein kinase [unclassified Ruegeria]NOD76845.1 protein kinase [Ruegeria sp. HKCCD4332]NOD88355.1 protein kinase [Ruegeria sp. HKCCD4318]NOE13264.1 protein kinase [Ruegeria sp. HKCCD4318-2]NOG11194.1 protein kinase [Ruegeria sp. HKCCD4315]